MLGLPLFDGSYQTDRPNPSAPAYQISQTLSIWHNTLENCLFFLNSLLLFQTQFVIHVFYDGCNRTPFICFCFVPSCFILNQKVLKSFSFVFFPKSSCYFVHVVGYLRYCIYECMFKLYGVFLSVFKNPRVYHKVQMLYNLTN